MDSTQIMMSLQVQDITSQQLAAVNSLLQTVQNKLGEIMVHFRNTEIGELISTSARRPMQDETHATQVSSLHRAIAYDSDVGSALSGDPNRQNAVDSILASFQDGGISTPAPTSSSSSSQNDIDALFGSSASASPASANTNQASTPSGDPASQNDIDALFGGGQSNDSASQDDIDALFK
jgi:hypothetical protein